MNAKRKEKAVKDYKGFAELQENELSEILVKDGFDIEKEVPVIIEAIKTKTPEQKQFSFSELYLTEMDEDTRENEFVKCKAWDDYREAERAYSGIKSVDYLKMNASGCFQIRLNKYGDKYSKLVGLLIHKEQPLTTTRISVNAARRMNEQVFNTANAEGSRHYYLIKELIKL